MLAYVYVCTFGERNFTIHLFFFFLLREGKLAKCIGEYGEYGVVLGEQRHSTSPLMQ